MVRRRSYLIISANTTENNLFHIYILFIEELDKFRCVEEVSMFLTCIGQSRLMEQFTGLLFGHYSEDVSLLLYEVLERFGKNTAFRLLIVMISVMAPTMRFFLLEEKRF